MEPNLATQQSAAQPQVFKIEFKTPGALVVYLLADALMGSCLKAMQQANFVGAPEFGALFLDKAREFEVLRDEWLKKQDQKIIVAQPGDVPPITGP